MARICIQLSPVKDDFARDTFGTLRAIAAMDYDGVEFAGVADQVAAEFLDLLTKTKLCVTGVVVPLSQLQDSHVDCERQDEPSQFETSG